MVMTPICLLRPLSAATEAMSHCMFAGARQTILSKTAFKVSQHRQVLLSLFYDDMICLRNALAIMSTSVQSAVEKKKSAVGGVDCSYCSKQRVMIQTQFKFGTL